VLFTRPGGTPVRIDVGFTRWVFVTSDGRYIVTEPLHVLELREWKQYPLVRGTEHPELHDHRGYLTRRQAAPDSRADCGMDCKDVPVEYYELTLP
jgi:hypothetical protein